MWMKWNRHCRRAGKEIFERGERGELPSTIPINGTFEVCGSVHV